MSWRRWKIGAVVALATGLATGGAGFGLGLHWKEALVLLGGSIAKDFLLYIKDHPVDSIVFNSDTTITKKEDEKTTVAAG